MTNAPTATSQGKTDGEDGSTAREAAAFALACDRMEVPQEDRPPLRRLHATWAMPGASADERMRSLLADYDHWRLFQKAKAGDARAGELFEKHWTGYARAFCAGRFSREEVEEIRSDFFARVHERLDSRFAWQCPFGAYLRGLLVNLARDLIRRRVRARGREVGVDELDARTSAASGDAPASPEGVLLARERGDAVRVALRQLAPGDRHVILQCVLGDEPATAIASELGITVSTLYQRLHRAKKRLKSALEDGPSPARGR